MPQHNNLKEQEESNWIEEVKGDTKQLRATHCLSAANRNFMVQVCKLWMDNLQKPQEITKSKSPRHQIQNVYTTTFHTPKYIYLQVNLSSTQTIRKKQPPSKFKQLDLIWYVLRSAGPCMIVQSHGQGQLQIEELSSCVDCRNFPWTMRQLRSYKLGLDRL